MKAARWRISGMGELLKEWKRSSSARTRFLSMGPLPLLSFPDTKALAACASPEDALVFPAGLCMLKLFRSGLAGFPECTVLAVVVDNNRGASLLPVVPAHCRHTVLSAARAAESIEGAIGAEPSTDRQTEKKRKVQVRVENDPLLTAQVRW